MAQRIATEYVKAKLQLTREEMIRFVRFFDEQQVRLHVKVLDNGSQEVVLEDRAGREEIRFTFEREEELYVCVLSCRLLHPGLTNAMRKAVMTFKGDAIVRRIYSHYTMIYHYESGMVRRIEEKNDAGLRLVFQYKDRLGELERQFREREVERRIERLQSRINELLDLRNGACSAGEVQGIDRQLQICSHQLFVLEA
ncbi:hypothetical protein [Paenibacillus beijingensis]|uniref:Non-ribosomal peptide synthetase module n=1 Tax=Paenibacillus beijingensis TaxID=1126833 RepID=A0A0D5NM82_9BACL|nr:hypothetical protein [Paenibacillus beijingensis]AJY76043.1 non-ribosomal peptide synthetase module [Paenibacillus beijingensis]